jgi:hypothetical protein
MQIHEITLKNKTVNEGVLGAIADVAGRSIMQKYGGQQGQYVGPQASASTAQAGATQINAPLIDKLAKSLMQTYKSDVGALIKTSRDPNTQAQATSATNLQDQALMLPLQKSIAKSLKFDYTQLPDKVDPAAFNNKGKDTAMAIKNHISDLIMKIAAYEKNPTPQSAKEQMRLFTTLAQEVSSAQSMNRFQGTSGNTQGTKYEALLSKVRAGTPLTPTEQIQLNTAIKNGELNVA